MFARSYVLQLSDNIKRSKEQAVKRGSWMGLSSYRIYAMSRMIKEKRTLFPIQIEHPFISKLFEMYATGNHSLQTYENSSK